MEEVETTGQKCKSWWWSEFGQSINYTSSEVQSYKEKEQGEEDGERLHILLLQGLSKVKSNLWPGFATYFLEITVFDGICDVVNFHREYKRRNTQIS